MAEYVTVAQVSDIPEGTRKTVDVGEYAVLVVNVDGTYYAIEDTCTHDGNELSDGDLVGHTIECTRHGARFDLRTGKGTFPAVQAVTTFPVRVEGNAVQVAVEQ